MLCLHVSIDALYAARVRNANMHFLPSLIHSTFQHEGHDSSFFQWVPRNSLLTLSIYHSLFNVNERSSADSEELFGQY